MAPHSALPRRPLTVGELLDAAAQLMRNRAMILIPVVVLLACAEQALLYPLRVFLGVDFFYEGFTDGFAETLGSLWIVMSIGCGLEAMIITLLGTRTGAAAADDLTGAETGWSALVPRRRDLGALLVSAPVAGLTTAVTAFFGPLWIVGYGLFSMAGAVMGLERRGPLRSLGRAAAMAFRNGMRGIGVRVLGYFAWVLLRLGFLLGMVALLNMLPLSDLGSAWVMGAGFVVANCAAYLFLAALDATVLVEGRFRSEGFDIWLSRAQQHATLTPQLLAAQK